ILAIDVWEHAYYLNYKNLRADYVAKLFEIIDWTLVEANYQRVMSK
ncbi:MAG: Fe-Mn family superoxide dismutase, partial [Eubacterium sp.]|nr:Fe-Mn family superoxide dismutase [Eubacterium sp.]